MNNPEKAYNLREQARKDRAEAERMLCLELTINLVGETMNRALQTLEGLRNLYLGKDVHDPILAEAEIDFKEGERLREELEVSLARYRCWLQEARSKREHLHYRSEETAKAQAGALESGFDPQEQIEYGELISQNRRLG
jgi:hypothetical protein